MNKDIVKELLYKMADDQLILGHRNSEWTGMGPLLEEDIAFSSMAQDKVGQSYALYQLLHDLGEGEPDSVAFLRNAENFHNCQLTELPNGEYDFSLVRHFLFDYAEILRFQMLKESSFTPLAEIAVKIEGELRYHVMHAKTWMKQLGSGKGAGRMQESLDKAFPYALGVFEVSPFEDELIHTGVFGGEIQLRERWLTEIGKVFPDTDLQLPDPTLVTPEFGGRTGTHTEHLQPLLDEMAEVFRTDPTADW